MRKAYELGWANACAFGWEMLMSGHTMMGQNISSVLKHLLIVSWCRGCRPRLVAVDDILFQKPVEIGSLLLLSSQVRTSLTSLTSLYPKALKQLIRPSWHFLLKIRTFFWFFFWAGKKVQDHLPQFGAGFKANRCVFNVSLLVSPLIEQHWNIAL